MGWNKAANDFVFAPDSNWTLIWHLLISMQWMFNVDVRMWTSPIVLLASVSPSVAGRNQACWFCDGCFLRHPPWWIGRFCRKWFTFCLLVGLSTCLLQKLKFPISQYQEKAFLKLWYTLWWHLTFVKITTIYVKKFQTKPKKVINFCYFFFILYNCSITMNDTTNSSLSHHST